MNFETMRDFLDKNSELGKETRKIIHKYAMDGFVLPILPVVIKEGITGKIQIEDFEGTIEELISKHYYENSPDKEIAKKRINDFYSKIQ